MWITAGGAVAAKKPAAPPPTKRGPLPRVQGPLTRGLDHDVYRTIVEILAESRRVSVGADRHPLVKFEDAGHVPTPKGLAKRILVHARRLRAEGPVLCYDVVFLIHPDGEVRELR